MAVRMLRGRCLRGLGRTLALGLAVCGLSCDSSGPPPAGDRLSVFVSIEPQACFVERVGGRHVAVEVLVAAGQSPATYAPTLQQVVRLGKARAYFRIGVPFEGPLLERIASSAKSLEVVDTRAGIRLRRLDEPHEHEGEEAGHGHEAGIEDPHVWLDPKLVKVQARTICATLSRLDPGHAADYQANLAAFEAELDAVDAKIAKALAPVRGREILVFHPAYGYFADAYGLKQVAVESGGKSPTSRQLVALIERAKAGGVKVIFVQPQFSRRSAEAVAGAIGGAVVPMDPLARDYIANLERMAEAVGQALGKKST